MRQGELRRGNSKKMCVYESFHLSERCCQLARCCGNVQKIQLIGVTTQVERARSFQVIYAKRSDDDYSKSL